jgi:hypothetical protein
MRITGANITRERLHQLSPTGHINGIADVKWITDTYGNELEKLYFNTGPYPCEICNENHQHMYVYQGLTLMQHVLYECEIDNLPKYSLGNCMRCDAEVIFGEEFKFNPRFYQILCFHCKDIIKICNNCGLSQFITNRHCFACGEVFGEAIEEAVAIENNANPMNNPPFEVLLENEIAAIVNEPIQVRNALGARPDTIWIKDFNCDPLDYLGFIGNPDNGLYYGVEYELEPSGDKQSLAKDITEAFTKKVICIHDGSLIEGFEVVTAPMTLKKQKALWKEFFEKGYKYESYHSDRCSIHVHMSRDAFTPLQIAKLKMFTYEPTNIPFIEVIAGRNLHSGWGEHYANINGDYKITDLVEIKNGQWEAISKIAGLSRDEIKQFLSTNDLSKFKLKHQKELAKITKKIKVISKNADQRQDRARYHAINLQNASTIEFRMFRGCNKLSTLIKNLEFCQALYDFSAGLYIGLANPKNSYLHLMRYIKEYRHEYPVLYKYMKKYVYGNPQFSNRKEVSTSA